MRSPASWIHRAEGVLEPRRWRGTIGTPSGTPADHPPRTVYRDEIGYYFDRTAQPWRALQPPTFDTRPCPLDIAALLDIAPGAEAVIRGRVMGTPATGQATSHIPAASPPSCLSWLLPTRARDRVHARCGPGPGSAPGPRRTTCQTSTRTSRFVNNDLAYLPSYVIPAVTGDGGYRLLPFTAVNATASNLYLEDVFRSWAVLNEAMITERNSERALHDEVGH